MDLAIDLRSPNGHLRLRLETLTRLRWLGIAGQILAILVVQFGLKFSLPFELALGVVGIAAIVNLLLQFRFPTAQRLNAGAATALLAFDIIQLAALLYLTGGLANPFAFLFLAPVLIAATTLEPRWTVLLGLIATACAAILMVWHEPLPWFADGSIRIPQLYVLGIFTAMILGLAFISIYAWRVSEESRQLSDAFAATELALAREQNLSALDGLAAAAAHQLGTPLATIALIVNEMGRMSHTDPALIEDIAILRQQSDRCREILGRIASLGEEAASPLAHQSLYHLLEDVSSPYRGFGKDIAIDCSGQGPEPVFPHNPGLLHGIGNIVENAVDFGRSRTDISARWTATQVSISVEDDGPGFAPEILARLGDPYLSTRRYEKSGRALGSSDTARSEGGLGLGLFIAKTLIERSGGKLTARNVGPPSGARVEISWPRAVIEAGR